MIRHAIAAAALLAAVPAFAQSQQQALDARYDRALAAGYKALMLCSAIANAERNGATRTPESVMEWELSGIQAPLDGIVGELPYEVNRISEGPVSHVSVHFAVGMPPRFALHDPQNGCSLRPVGYGGAAVPAEMFAAVLESRVESSALAGEPVLEVATHHRLDELVGQALDQSPEYGNDARTTAVIVQRNGAIANESYLDGFRPATPQRTWSVAKSIAATLVGAAVLRGEADVSASAELGADAADPRRAITIDHLLRMASGRYSDTPGNRTDPLYFGGSRVEETALHWPLVHKPSTVYRYANNDTLAAVEAIEETFAEDPPAALFAKLGMNHTVAETDWQGSYILSSQVWSTARDLARLGQLYLNDGMWNGERIIPEGWVEYVSSPSGPQPEGPFGYGAGFWLFNKSEGVPPDTIAAMGNRGQFIVIVPSKNLVIVRRGEDPAGARFNIAAFTRDVLESLTE